MKTCDVQGCELDATWTYTEQVNGEMVASARFCGFHSLSDLKPLNTLAAKTATIAELEAKVAHLHELYRHAKEAHRSVDGDFYAAVTQDERDAAYHRYCRLGDLRRFAWAQYTAARDELHIAEQRVVELKGAIDRESTLAHWLDRRAKKMRAMNLRESSVRYVQMSAVAGDRAMELYETLRSRYGVTM